MTLNISPFITHYLQKSKSLQVFIGSLENGIHTPPSSMRVTPDVARILSVVSLNHGVDNIQDSMTEGSAKPLIEEMLSKRIILPITDSVEAARKKVFGILEDYFHSQIRAAYAANGKGTILDHIETTNRCNMKCIMCPRSSSSYTVPVTDLDVGLFWEVLRQLPNMNNGKLLRLWHFGDPLLDPYLEKRIAYTSELGMQCAISINPVNINLDRIGRILLNKGLAVIVVSLDADDSDTYRRKRGGRFDRALRLLYGLIDLKEQVSPQTKIIIQYISLNGIEEGAERFIKRWSQDSRVEWLVRVFQGLPDMSHKYPEYPINQMICVEMWRPPYVLGAWGDLLPCPIDYNYSLKIGSVASNDLKDLVTSSRFETLRKQHYDLMLSQADTLCLRCGQRNILNELIKRYVTSEHPLYEKYGRKLGSPGALIL